MAFKFFLDGFELPVAPAKLETVINNQNKTFVLANMREVNVIKAPGLTDINFIAPLPRMEYPWKNNNTAPVDVLGKLEELKTSMKPFQFIVNCEYDMGSTGADINMTVSLEDYKRVDDAEDFSDMAIEINLKQWVDYSVKIIYGEPASAGIEKSEGADWKASSEVLTFKEVDTNKTDINNPNSAKNRDTHTVKEGETLWEVAKKSFGDGSVFKDLYVNNKETIDKENEKKGTSKYTIHEGQVISLVK